MGELWCLTVRQPWATLLVDPTLPKTIETRSRRTNIRGTIGIIAAKHRPAGETLRVGDYVQWLSAGYGGVREWKLDGPQGRAALLPLGYLIGTVDLYDCAPIGDSFSFRTGTWDGDGGDFPQRPVIVNHGHLGAGGWELVLDDDGEVTAIPDQLPYGNFQPGGWAWLTRNPVLFVEPVPMAGSQGWKTITR
jgi:hypothetical protein